MKHDILRKFVDEAIARKVEEVGAFIEEYLELFPVNESEDITNSLKDLE